MDLGAFAERHVGLGGLDDGIEARDPRPGPEDPVVEFEAVHLGPDDLAVDAALDRPAGRVDGGEAVLESLDTALLSGHGFGRMIGHATDDAGLLEFVELLPEGQQVVVASARGP